MTARHALLTVVSWGCALAAVGAVLGATLGTLAPSYYRSLFSQAHAAEFHPAQVGAGLGATQGFGVGVALAFAWLALLVWRDARRSNVESSGAASSEGAAASGTAMTASSADGEGRRLARRFVLAGAFLSLTGLTSVVAFVAGGLVGQEQLYRAWTDAKVRRIEGVLASREFPDARPGFSSAAQVYVEGSVPSDEAKRALRDRLAEEFGQTEAEFMVGPLDVRTGSSDR